MLFNFIWEIARKLQGTEKICKNFALIFLLNLSKFLGFYPSISKINKPFFELETGEFSDKITDLKLSLNRQKSSFLKSLLQNKKVIIPQEVKSELLKDLLYYYKLHHYNLDGITSHQVIATLRK